MLTVGSGRLASIGALGMARGLWLLSVRFSLPEDIAAIEFETLDQPVMDTLGRLAATLSEVEALSGFLVFLLANDSGQENSAPPDNRT